MDRLLDSVSVRAEAGASVAALRAPSAAKAAARAELGLPTDRPIVMVGHQAEMWHAGILAKFCAAAALARHYGAALAWLTPDQDANEPTMIAYPAQTHEGRLKRREWLVDASAFVRPGTPTGSRLAIEPGSVPRDARTEWPHAAARAGLERMHLALGARQGEASLARQYTVAALDLVQNVLGVSVHRVLMASEMSRGAAFGMWSERMRREARGCVLAYNAAAQAQPEAGVRDLEMGPRWELPLWALTPEKPRRPVHSDGELPGRIAPRALAMTGFARTLLCDAWVMGTGGEAYDEVTRRWLQDWTGSADLAPGVVATATLRMPLRDGPLPDTERAADAAWRFHHARHHPAMLDQEGRQHERDRLVQAMASAPRHSLERRRLFAEMREVLSEARREGRDRLEQLRDEAEEEHERLQDMEQVLDRTWPFALHEDGALRELDEQVRAAVTVLA
ncbi:MAG: hypothetical protein ACIAS6_07485 [Phycisphaerales bacterium JB060]